MSNHRTRLLSDSYFTMLYFYQPTGAQRCPGQNSIKIPIGTFYISHSFFSHDLLRFWSLGYPGVRGLGWLVILGLRIFPELVWWSVQNLVEIGTAVHSQFTLNPPALLPLICEFNYNHMKPSFKSWKHFGYKYHLISIKSHLKLLSQAKFDSLHLVFTYSIVCPKQCACFPQAFKDPAPFEVALA